MKIDWKSLGCWWLGQCGVSLVAQLVKNLPAMQETWVWSLGWEDPLKEGMATHCSILAWRIPMDRGDWRATVHGVPKSQTWLSHQAQHSTAQSNGDSWKRSIIIEVIETIVKRKADSTGHKIEARWIFGVFSFEKAPLSKISTLIILGPFTLLLFLNELLWL